MNFFEGRNRLTIKKPFNFGPHSDHDPDAGIINELSIYHFVVDESNCKNVA